MDKVMIIDDEVWVTEVIRNIIDWNSFGFQVARVCHDGEEAISEIRDIHPELLMTDIRMPGKTGLEIIREVSEKMPDILCVVISGYSAIAPSVLLIMLVVRIISALLITACLTKYLADSLAKAGVLRGYAISQGMEVPGEEA